MQDRNRNFHMRCSGAKRTRVADTIMHDAAGGRSDALCWAHTIVLYAHVEKVH